PYDYYPGYYADVEPYYYNEGVYDSVPAADPNVTAVQNGLAKLGYYHEPVDGLYGRATRDAVAHYQNDHHLAITGTLTTQTLQSLGVAPSVASWNLEQGILSIGYHENTDLEVCVPCLPHATG